MKISRTYTGWILEIGASHYQLPRDQTENLTARDDLQQHLERLAGELEPMRTPLPDTLRAPMDQQEIWAAGVTSELLISMEFEMPPTYRQA